MAITSVGYDGTVNEVQWAGLHPASANRPCVISGGIVSIVSGADRTVRVPAGTFYGWGILDTITGNNDRQAGVIASGTRWDTLVIRRDWTTNTTSIVIVPGTSTKAIAAGVQNDPGNIADQVLGLLRLTAGFSTVQEYVDLREWHLSVAYRFASELPDPAQFLYGQVILQNNGAALDAAVRRGGAGTESWDSLLCRKWTNLSMASGWRSVADRGAQWRVVGDRLEFRGAIELSNGGFLPSTYTTAASVTVAIARPANMLAYVNSSTFSGTLAIDTSGVLQVAASGANSARRFYLDNLSHPIGA